MNEKFKIKTYGYCELAQLYFPLIAKQSATVQFRRWIKVNGKLQQELTTCGFNKFQKLLTPKQVAIIIRFIGKP